MASKLATTQRHYGGMIVFIKILNRMMGTVFVLLVVAYLVLSFLPSFIERKDLNEKLSQKQDTLREIEIRNKQAEREIELLKNNPEYIETIARDRLNVMKPGETIYRGLNKDTPPAPTKVN